MLCAKFDGNLLATFKVIALPCLALKLSVEFDEDAVLLLVTTEMASETKVVSTQCIADVTPWTTRGRCTVRMSAHATFIRRLVELRHVGV